MTHYAEADTSSGTIFRPWLGGSRKAYNNMLMPLANCRDKITQVKWGRIRDFELPGFRPACRKECALPENRGRHGNDGCDVPPNGINIQIHNPCAS